MLVGHYAVGFIGKRAVPGVPLAALMTAAMFPDLLTFVLQLAGVEHAGLTPGHPRYLGLNAYDQAISHSLVMDVVWAALFAVGYSRWRADKRGAMMLAGAVLSHWLFDFMTHRPDMPLAPGVDFNVGLGLWNSIGGTLAVEGGLWMLALAAYATATRPIARTGTYCLWVPAAALTMWFVVTPFAPQTAGDFTTRGLATFLTIHILVTSFAHLTDRYRVLQSRKGL